MAVTMSSSQAQQNFGAALDRALSGEDVIIERYGIPRAAIVAYGRYQRLLEASLEQRTGAAEIAGQAGQLREAAVAYRIGERAPAQKAASPANAAAYRYVTRVPGICGGRPIIRGTRIPVRAIVGYLKLGMSADETLASLPHLTAAQVYEALSYYYDHMEEIEGDIQENQLEHLIERYGLQVAADGRITIAS